VVILRYIDFEELTIICRKYRNVSSFRCFEGSYRQNFYPKMGLTSDVSEKVASSNFMTDNESIKGIIIIMISYYFCFILYFSILLFILILLSILEFVLFSIPPILLYYY
jgi:hypothetical protein